ncbi:hypothetical protein GGR38_004303 [Novosphingobium sediminicola]|uniref:Uncharacterized protein n=1 Tax=Novosphingobium sediminicola TaxID=563162 RepID=A0A7W6CIX5_9SPHN|nr:hypothetical protein [Novosphingobium sediminicola]
MGQDAIHALFGAGGLIESDWVPNAEDVALIAEGLAR